MLTCLHCHQPPKGGKLYSRGLCRPCYRSLSRSGSIDLYPTQEYYDHTASVATWLIEHKMDTLEAVMESHGLAFPQGLWVTGDQPQPDVAWCVHCEVNDKTTHGAGRGLCTKCYTQLTRSNEINTYPSQAFWDKSGTYAEWLITNDITVLRDVSAQYGYEIVSS
jgi:hypothetical protein